MFTPEQTIDYWLRVFAKEFLVNRARDILKQKLVNTNDLIRSLDVKINSDPKEGRFLLIFFSRTYGRWQDMRRRYVHPGGEEMVKELEAWAEKEGIQKFMNAQYRGVFKGKTSERVLNRIAWGIISKYRKKKTAPVRGWYRRNVNRDIDVFYDLLLKAYRETVLEQTKSSIQGK